MSNLRLKELNITDEESFLSAMHRSRPLHDPWISAPQTHQDFIEFYHRYQQPNHRCFLLLTKEHDIAGVFNVSEIIRGVFQNAYLGYSSITGHEGQGHTSRGLKLLLEKVFVEMELHRIEANIQPANIRSINLVKNNGFRKEGYSERYIKINGEWQDFERWAITYEDWIGSQK